MLNLDLCVWRAFFHDTMGHKKRRGIRDFLQIPGIRSVSVIVSSSEMFSVFGRRGRRRDLIVCLQNKFGDL